jgi:hypothetical protein
LKANVPLGPAIAPVWRGVPAPGVSSYQRTTEGPPFGPATVCWVQIPSVPVAGSVTATAWVSRMSLLSSVSLVPGWGTAAGTEKAGTVTGVVLSTSLAPVLLF